MAHSKSSIKKARPSCPRIPALHLTKRFPCLPDAKEESKATESPVVASSFDVFQGLDGLADQNDRYRGGGGRDTKSNKGRGVKGRLNSEDYTLCKSIARPQSDMSSDDLDSAEDFKD